MRKIRMYAHVKPVAIERGNSVAQMVEIAKQRKAQGFTAAKYSIIPPIKMLDSQAAHENHIERFAAVREALGKAVDLAIDFHGRVSPAMAIRLARGLEPYYPYPPENGEKERRGLLGISFLQPGEHLAAPTDFLTKTGSSTVDGG